MTLQKYQLVMRTGPTPGQVFELAKEEIHIGRDLSNDIIIADPEISRQHARMYLQAGGYVLEDLGSTNGTYVDGQRLIGPHLMQPGELIYFGEKVSLAFEVLQDLGVTTPRGVYEPVPTPEKEPSIPSTPAQAPVSEPHWLPVAQPVPQQPETLAAEPPQPVYTEPASSTPGEEQYEEEKISIKWNWILAGCGCLTLVICGLGVAGLLWIDSDPTGARWCDYLGFLVNILRPGACP